MRFLQNGGGDKETWYDIGEASNKDKQNTSI